LLPTQPYALGTSNERVGEGGEGPAVLDAFLDANCGDYDDDVLAGAVQLLNPV
jgi:hypothetical protein